MVSPAITAAEMTRYLVIPKPRIKFTERTLGKGAFGAVNEVEYDGKLCAGREIPCVLLELATKTEATKIKDNLLRECNLWSTLKHPNIVSLHGLFYQSREESRLPVIVMEKMKESITTFVEKHDNIPLLVKLSILHDVSTGLKYLHDHDPPIVHGNLSPNNILVTHQLEAKITDLGVAKAFITGSSSTIAGAPGNAIFTPREALVMRLHGPPLDVFSFGGVILYMTSRQWPTPSIWSHTDPKTKKPVLSTEVTRRQQYIDRMTGSDVDLKPLVMSCLDNDPQLRPQVEDLTMRIKSMKEDYSKKATYDGMNTLSWLKQLSLPAELQTKSIYAEEQSASGEDVKRQPTIETPTTLNLLNEAVNIEWKEGTSAPVARSQHSAVAYNGAIYVGGGSNIDNGETNAVYTIDVYYSDDNQWGNSIATPHALFGMTTLLNKLVIVGGKKRNGKATKRVLAFKNGKWKKHAKMPAPRIMTTAVSYRSMMIVMGGCGSDGKTIIDTTEVLDNATGHWFRCDDLPKPLWSPQSVIVDTTLYVLGGVDQDHNDSTAVYAASLHTLSDHQLKWQYFTDAPCAGLAAIDMNNKYMIVLGGRTTEKKDVFMFNTSSTWIPITTVPLQVCFSAAACDSCSRLVVTGGLTVQEGKSTNKVWVSSMIALVVTDP